VTQLNDLDIDKMKEQLRYMFYEFWMLAETHKRLLAGAVTRFWKTPLLSPFALTRAISMSFSWKLDW